MKVSINCEMTEEQIVENSKQDFKEVNNSLEIIHWHLHQMKKNGFDKQKYNEIINQLRIGTELTELSNSPIPPDSMAVLKDRVGNPIMIGDLFTFEYLQEFDKPIRLVGRFQYCPHELRFYVEITEKNENGYNTLPFSANGSMRKFELIKYQSN